MKWYKVSIWLGEDQGSPDRITYVQSDDQEKRSIIRLALQKIDKHPKSYHALVEEARNVETQYVVMIKDSNEVDRDVWYKDRDGEIFAVSMCYRGPDKPVYVTSHLLGITRTSGYIYPEHCVVINTFMHEKESFRQHI